MTTMLNGFHPGFEALSSHADQSGVEAARTRVGRHVGRCASCAATVEEIRAMGDAARDAAVAASVDAASPTLWARIERARTEEAVRGVAPRVTASPESPTFTPVPSLLPATHPTLSAPWSYRTLGAVLAAAGIVCALVLLPTSRGETLHAGTTLGTWRFTPEHPAPGSTVTVRYIPAPHEEAPRTMMLLAGFARPRGNTGAEPYSGINALQDSLATLVRQADGTYAARFTLPADFSAMVARLSDSSGRARPRIMTTDGPVSRTYEAVEILVGGDGRGAPSLESLTDAVDLWRGGGVARYDVSDTLIKYFPSEPIGYAVATMPRAHSLMEQLINWYKRGERQYLRFDSRLMGQKTVSVDHDLAMIRFAHRIEEPGEVGKWTMRLAHEHPDDPRALYLYSSMVADMLLRPNTLDSVRRSFAFADTLWERSGHRGASESLARAAATVGDRERRVRWTERAMRSGARNWRGSVSLVDAEGLDDPATRRYAAPLLRARTEASCVRAPGKFSMWGGWMSWEEECVAGRAAGYQGLSRIALLEGSPARALSLADSSLALMESARRCWTAGSHVRRGDALLAMGDRRGAASELAWGAVGQSWQAFAWADSVARLLRPDVDSAEFSANVARATAERNTCVAAVNQRNRDRAAAEAARRQAGGA